MKSWQWLLVGVFVLAALAAGGVAVDVVPGASTVWPDVVKRFAMAIANAEGFFLAGSLSSRKNNPGDISDASGVIQYATLDEGWNALYQQVYLMFYGDPSQTRYSSSMTIAQVAQIYATDWQNWSRNVASYLGVSTDTPLSNIV
jgi:hypothetical protein